MVHFCICPMRFSIHVRVVFSLVICLVSSAAANSQEADDKVIYRQVRVPSADRASVDQPASDAEQIASLSSKWIRGCVGADVGDEEVRLEPLDDGFARTLGDRFAKTILRDHDRENRLGVVLNALKADNAANELQTFVVDEFIRLSEANGPSALTRKRCVLAFSHQPLLDEVMISMSFSPDEFRKVLAPGDLVEIWAWDEGRGVLNFYEWAQSGVWSFVGSSPLADDPPSLAASNRCLECHRSGVPLMKELKIPWNNWESTESPRSYLKQGNATSWPVAADIEGLASAATLEPRIRTIIKRFNRKRLDRNTQLLPDGSKQIRNAHFLLHPLFVEQEVNLTSSRTQSGLSPFATAQDPAERSFSIPAGFFVRHELISGGSGITGIGIPDAAAFRSLPEVSLSDYVSLVSSKRIGLVGVDGGALQFKTPVDTDFAWFTPERSFVDDHLIDRLIKAKVVSKEFVAAICQLELKQPMFSTDLRVVFETPDLLPDTFIIPATLPSDHRDHPLTDHVLKFLDIASPPAESPLGRLQSLLGAEDPISALRHEVSEYAESLSDQLSGPSANMELEKLFESLILRRRAVLNDPRLRPLDETTTSGTSAGLLPLPIP